MLSISKIKVVLVITVVLLIVISCEAKKKKKSSKGMLLRKKETNPINFIRLAAMRLIYGIATRMGLGEQISDALGGIFVPPGVDDYDDYDVITTQVRGHAHCSADELVRCAKPLSILHSGLTLVSTKADLEKVCPDLTEAVSCIHHYSRYCMSRADRFNIIKIFHGTAEMVHNLCRNETYQEEFLQYAPCMHTVEPQNEVCFKQYTKKINEIESTTPMEGITEEDLIAFKSSFKRKRDAADEGTKNICCSFQEYVECSTSITRSVCGNEAADFSKMFLNKMSSSMLQLHCQNYGHRECGLVTSSSKKIDSSILSLPYKKEDKKKQYVLMRFLKHLFRIQKYWRRFLSFLII